MTPPEQPRVSLVTGASSGIGEAAALEAARAGDHLVLGGVRIPFGQGIVAHSDGDVVIHAVCDALLGAMGEGDLGRHYPSSDHRFKDISSLKLLEDVVGKMRAKRYHIVNVDTIIIAQAPRLSSHLSAMQEQMAQVLGHYLLEPRRRPVRH